MSKGDTTRWYQSHLSGNRLSILFMQIFSTNYVSFHFSCKDETFHAQTKLFMLSGLSSTTTTIFVSSALTLSLQKHREESDRMDDALPREHTRWWSPSGMQTVNRKCLGAYVSQHLCRYTVLWHYLAILNLISRRQDPTINMPWLLWKCSPV